EESNNFTSVASVAVGEDGLWDFALIDNDGTSSVAYCLRVVESSGALLDSYSIVPEVTTAAAPIPVTYQQSSFRTFANANSTNVGAALASQDVGGVLAANGDAFRLRSTVHIGGSALAPGAA